MNTALIVREEMSLSYAPTSTWLHIICGEVLGKLCPGLLLQCITSEWLAMQVHNELSKSDYFQKLNINDNIFGGQWPWISSRLKPWTSSWALQTKVLATPREGAPRECRWIGNTLIYLLLLGEIITERTCCLHYIVQEWTPHLGPDHYANRKLVLKH